MTARREPVVDYLDITGDGVSVRADVVRWICSRVPTGLCRVQVELIVEGSTDAEAER